MAITTFESLSSVLDTSRKDLRVVVSGNGAVPWSLLRAVDAILPTYRMHMLNAPVGVPDRTGVVLESAFVGAGARRSPRLAYYPCRLSQVPLLFKRRLPVDVVLIHTSLPIDGKVSLGIEVNILPAAIESARDYLDAEDQWNDEEKPETTKAVRNRNLHVRRWKRLDAAITELSNLLGVRHGG